MAAKEFQLNLKQQQAKVHSGTNMYSSSRFCRFVISLGRRDRAWRLILSLVALSVLNFGYLSMKRSNSHRSEKRLRIPRYVDDLHENVREPRKDGAEINRGLNLDGTIYLAASSVRYNHGDANGNKTGASYFYQQTDVAFNESEEFTEVTEKKLTNGSFKYACPQFKLTNFDSRVNSGKCEPHKPSNKACVLARSLYSIDPALSKCKSESVNICSLQVEENRGKKRLISRCSRAVCKGKHAIIIVYAINPVSGYLEAVKSFASARNLETALPDIVAETVRHGFYFLYLKCVRPRNITSASQLLPVSPQLTVHMAGKKTRYSNVVNVNIVLIDSFSRAHFYRSLPKTINLFKTWAVNPSAAPASVLDFELFQAIEGHTAENTHALFTGTFLPPYNRDSDATPSVEMDVLFGHFKRAGYQTMWQDDLCWTAIWGLMADLYASDWVELQEKTKKAFIDQTGLTHSSCELLASLGVETPFNGPSGDQICYNGVFQHTYLLRYTRDVFKAIASSSKALPLLNYLALNVAHDDIGRRAQTLDPDLADYVTAMAHDNSTLTIILADHGNTYTPYTMSLEGRFEMFHPSLFVIVPNGVAELLGDKAMSALRINQRRLVTMVDVHHSLMGLAGPLRGGVKLKGLFAEIEANRTCEDVELRTPNLCVCEGWDSPTTNDTSKLALAEFAIGQFNNLMQVQFAKNVKQANGNESKPLPIARSCQRLQPLRIENVRERNSRTDGFLVTSMDIYVAGANIGKHKEELFHVEVKSHEVMERTSLDLDLVQFERLTQFGHYKACADHGVQLKICVCSPPRNSSKRQSLSAVSWGKYMTFFDEKPRIRVLHDDKCVILLKRRHGNGISVAYEIANICTHMHFKVSFDAQVENMKVSRDVPFVVEAPAGSITFAMSARVHVPEWECTIEDEVKVISSVEV